MKVIYKAPGCAPEPRDIPNTLEELQATVGGYIETVTIATDAAIICNEEGRLQIRDWTDKEGNKRRSSEVVADSIYFGDSKKDTGMPAQSYSNNGSFSEVEDDGELPF